MMMGEYEAVERRKFQLALVRIVDLEQALLKAARRLENQYVKQPPDHPLVPTAIISELRAVAQAAI